MKRIILAFALIVSLVPFAFSQTGASGRGRSRNPKLTITCNVANASVTVVSTTAKTPNPVRGNVPFEQALARGTYRVTVQAPNYMSQTREVEITNSKTENFILQPATGRVIISLNPNSLNPRVGNPQAQIKIYDNGRKLPGNSLEQELPPGQHTIEVISGGFMIRKVINVQPGQVYRMEPVFDLLIR